MSVNSEGAASAKAAAQSHAGEKMMEAAKAKAIAQEEAAKGPKPTKPAPDTNIPSHKVVEAEIAKSNAQQNKEMLNEYFAAKKARQAQGEEPASIDVHGQNKRTGAVHKVDAGVVSIAATAIPTPSLDPRCIVAIEGYVEHEALLGPVMRAFEVAHQGISDVFAAREAAASNPEWTPATQTIKTAEYADKVQTRATKAWDSASNNLAKTIASYEIELSKPLETSNQTVTTVALAGEIRAHVKSMDHSDRQKFMREAFNSGDVRTLQAILSGPSFLSGFDLTSHEHFTRRFHEMQNPTMVSRLTVAKKAQELLDQRGPLIWREVTRAIGSDWTKINKIKSASNAAHAALIFNDLA